MNNKIVLGLVLMTVLCTGMVSATPSLTASYSISDSTPRAGSTIFYYVTVSNAGTSTAEDVEVRISNTESTFGGTYGTGAVDLGDIAAGNSETASFAINLRDSQRGVRDINTEISYEYDGGTYTSEYDYYFIIDSDQIQIISVSSSDEPLKPGRINDLEIVLGNSQNENARDFKISLSSDLTSTGSEIFRPVGGDTLYMDVTVSEDERLSIPFEIYVDESTTSGVYGATLSIEYIGGGIEKTESLELGIRVKGDVILEMSELESDPSEIKEGDEDVALSLTVQNIGQEQVRNLRMTFESQSPIELRAESQEKQSLGTVSAGSSATGTYYVDILEGAESGRYTLPVLLEYQDSKGEEFSEYRNVTIALKSTPIIEIEETVLEPGIVMQGDSVTLRIRVANKGSEDAEGVSIRVLEKIDQPFSYEEKTDSIGILNAGETGEAVISFDVDQDANLKKYGLELEVRYTDGDDVFTKDEVIAVGVNATESSDALFYIVVIVVLVIIGGLAWKVKQKLRQ